MPNNLDPNTVKRLAFIRFLYHQGREQANRPEPMSATALLAFHDAVELFLVLAGEHLNLNLPNDMKFGQYWERLTLPGGGHLGSKQAMARMNKLRVNLKHHGSIPSVTDLVQVKADVTAFLVDSSQAVFNVDFEHLSLTDLVTQPGTKKLLGQAKEHADDGRYLEALGLLRAAMDELLADYTDRHQRFGPDLRWIRGVPADQARGDRKLGEFLRKIYDAVSTMQSSMCVMAAGLDFGDYTRFQALTPDVVHTLSGQTTILGAEGRSATDFEFCEQFVVSTALRLAGNWDLERTSPSEPLPTKQP